jgi:dTMP kinase
VFITLEGIDRSGKSTQAALLAEALGPETLLLREPGGTALGEHVRDLLKDRSLELAPAAELLLFSAARSQLVNEVVAPAREAGRDLVCDRFIDSTVAYQGVARDLGIELVEQLSELVIGSCVPDLTLLLRLDPELAGSRRADDPDRFEAEGLEFQRAVAAAYDEIAARHSERIVVLDAAGAPETVHEQVMEAVHRGRAERAERR